MTTSEPSVDVLVLGAGLSGLSAARRLVETGLSVRVLEARDRVGGRTSSVPLGRGWADLGGQWMSPTQTRLADLARELGVETHAQYRQGSMLIADRSSDRSSDQLGAGRSWLERIPGFSMLELWYRIRALERMSRTIPDHDPESAARAPEWRSISVAEWLCQRVRSARARDALRLLTGLHLGAEPEDVSLLYLLHFARVTSGLTGRMAVGESQGETRFVGGAQRLSIRLAETLGARVQLGAQVTRIVDRSAEHGHGHDAPRDDARVEVWVGDQRHRARYALLAMAPALIDRLTITPALPEDRRRLARATPLSPVIKCALAYPRAFWRDAGLSGEAYRMDGAVRAIVDHTSADERQPALMAFIVGDAARELSGTSADQRASIVIEEVTGLFGPAAREVTDYRDKDWPADPLSTGCVAIMGRGMPDQVWHALRTPVGRLHFAGTETATRWPHYLDGAIEAGERAAAEISVRARSAADQASGASR